MGIFGIMNLIRKSEVLKNLINFEENFFRHDIFKYMEKNKQISKYS